MVAKSKMAMGHSIAVLERALLHIRAAGAEGIFWSDLLEAVGVKSDNQAGYLVHDLRCSGYLVQYECGYISCPDEVKFHIGAWMRHPEHGVIRVHSFPDHNKIVQIKLLWKDGATVRVHRNELSGR